MGSYRKGGVYTELGVGTRALTLHCFGGFQNQVHEAALLLASYVIFGKLVNLNAPQFLFL